MSPHASGGDDIMIAQVSILPRPELAMAQLLIRNLEDDVRDRLRERARRNRRSVEAEVREILRAAAVQPDAAPPPLGSRIAGRFAGLGRTDDIPELRGQAPRAADFDG